MLVPFEQLRDSDLIVDAVYAGGTAGNAGDDPIDGLLSCGNMGGFRSVGRAVNPHFVVLYTTLNDPDWPDRLESHLGRFVYYGDNKKPGRDLHDTPRHGNELLRLCFERLHADSPLRGFIPPFFVFSKAGSGRDVVFRGLAAPGAPGMGEEEDLVAFWRTTQNRRFLSYRAVFTLLDAPCIPRAWIGDLNSGDVLSAHAPDAWKRWVEQGEYRVLR